MDPVPQSSIASQTAETVCYQPLDETTSGCYEFAFEKELNSLSTNFLCNTRGWWCATENSFGQHVATAVAYDSCFCLYYYDNNETYDQPCTIFGGTLSDIRSEEEFDLITALVNDLIAIDAIQNYLCPAGFYYFNSSCFAILKAAGASGSPGLYTENYCRTKYYPAHGASLHSFDEQWFLFHLFYPTSCYAYAIYFYLGAYKNDTSSNFTYHWSDGSPTDYIPKWGYAAFTVLENNQYNWAGVSIGLCASGDLCDDVSFPNPPVVSCRVPSQNSTVYPILISSITSNSFTNSQQYNSLNEDKTVSSLDTFNTNPKITAAVCRKDQNIWKNVGSSYYLKTGFVGNFNDSVKLCNAINATLPTFYNVSEYIAFKDWWNLEMNSSEVWLGLIYDANSNNWTWINNCTWKHFPSFFRQCFDKNCGLSSTNQYAKYSNLANHAPDGVDPVNSTANLEVVCYKPVDENISSCYEFPFETRINNGSFLCSDGSWWCASDNVLGQNVSTAVAYDSCFCFTYDNESVSSAEQSCNKFNEILTDIRSDEEITLIITLANDLITNNVIQDYICPDGYSYFNNSCFAIFEVPTPGASGSPGLYVDNYCRTNYYPAHSASLHSFDEQWFLFHLYYPNYCYSSGTYFYLGAYKNDTSSNFTYHWYDGSPTDYIPKWGYAAFTVLENNQYNWAGVSIGLCSSGDLCDDITISNPQVISCRVSSQNSTVYPILISSITSNSFTNFQQYNLLNKDKTVSPLDSITNSSIASKICRKDRNVWEKVGSSYFLKTGIVGNFNDSVKLCNALNSTLSIFYNVLEYVAFKDWWNLGTNTNDVWLGLTYDPNSNNWTWINNCPWKYFPSFWRSCWNKKCSLPALTYFAKYSNQINGKFAPTGVEPVNSTSTAKFEAVCFKSNNSETSGCFDFPSEKDETFTDENNFLCNAGNWWCAKDHPLDQNISTAMETDSCFCLHYFNKSLLSDDQNCTSVNGTLADIRSYDEASLLVSLIDELVQNGSLPTNVCPTGFSFFNDSCYLIVKPTWNSTDPPGKFANDYCTANLTAKSASIHSLEEQWFLYWLYITTLGYNYQDFYFLGSYKNDTSPKFNYQWYDGTPMDYVPEWGFYSFIWPQNDSYNEIGVGLMILADDGRLGDDQQAVRPFACKTQVQNRSVYPILVSSVYNNQPIAECNTSCPVKNIMYQNKTFSSVSSGTSTDLMHKLCRKDRNIFTSTTKATSQITSTTMMSSTMTIRTSSGLVMTFSEVTSSTTTPTAANVHTSTTMKASSVALKSVSNAGLSTSSTGAGTYTGTTSVNISKSNVPTLMNPMTKTEQTVVKVVSTIGCTWIVATTAVSFFASLFLRRKGSFSFERQIRLGQEISLCLAHVLILTLSSRVDQKVIVAVKFLLSCASFCFVLKNLCNYTSLGLQFFFTSFFIFLFVESMQTYFINTNVISNGKCMSTAFMCLLSLGIPAGLVLVMAAIGFGNLSSPFACFVNFANHAFLANVLPCMLICATTIIVTESSGIGDFCDLPMTNPFQMHAALVSKGSLWFKIPLSISSWVLMTFGLHYQKFFWFTFIFGVNVALGWCIAMFHFLGNEEVKRFWMKITKNKS